MATEIYDELVRRISSVLLHMEACRDEIYVQEEGIDAFCGICTCKNLTYPCMESLMSWVGKIIQAMQRHPDQQRLQRTACRALALQMTDSRVHKVHDTSKESLARTVIAAMLRYPSDIQIQANGIQVLESIDLAIRKDDVEDKVAAQAAISPNICMITIKEALALFPTLLKFASLQDEHFRLCIERSCLLVAGGLVRMGDCDSCRIFSDAMIEAGVLEVALQHSKPPCNHRSPVDMLRSIVDVDRTKASIVLKKGVVKKFTQPECFNVPDFTMSVTSLLQALSVDSDFDRVLAEEANIEPALSYLRGEVPTHEPPNPMLQNESPGAMGTTNADDHARINACHFLVFFAGPRELAEKLLDRGILDAFAAAPGHYVYALLNLCAQKSLVPRIAKEIDLEAVLAPFVSRRFLVEWVASEKGRSYKYIHDECETALRALCKLCVDEDSCTTIIQKGGLECVWNVLRFMLAISPDNLSSSSDQRFAKVCVQACVVLCTMLQFPQNVAKIIRGQGAQAAKGEGVHTIISCMRRYPDSQCLQLAACECLFSMMLNGDTIEAAAEIRAHKGEEALLASINQSAACHTIRLRGCSVLVLCAEASEGFDPVLEEAIKLLVGGMATFSSQIDYQQGACTILADLIKTRPSLAEASFHAAGGVHALFRARRLGDGNLTVLVNAMLETMRQGEGDVLLAEIQRCEQSEREEELSVQALGADADDAAATATATGDRDKDKDRRNACCAVCGKQAHDVGMKKLRKCGMCTLAPRYCGAECQKLAWPAHKKDCKANPVPQSQE
jgi:hypothetical protein